jgi:hypothetical protein
LNNNKDTNNDNDDYNNIISLLPMGLVNLDNPKSLYCRTGPYCTVIRIDIKQYLYSDYHAMYFQSNHHNKKSKSSQSSSSLTISTKTNNNNNSTNSSTSKTPSTTPVQCNKLISSSTTVSYKVPKIYPLDNKLLQFDADHLPTNMPSSPYSPSLSSITPHFPMDYRDVTPYQYNQSINAY